MEGGGGEEEGGRGKGGRERERQNSTELNEIIHVKHLSQREPGT